MLGHWSAIAGAVQPPPWSGPVRVHRLPDDDASPELAPPRARPGPPKGTKPSPKGMRKPRASRSREARELRELQRRAQEKVLQVLPAWSLIEPGSARESLMQKAPATWWWPTP